MKLEDALRILSSALNVSVGTFLLNWGVIEYILYIDVPKVYATLVQPITMSITIGAIFFVIGALSVSFACFSLFREKLRLYATLLTIAVTVVTVEIIIFILL